MEKHRWIHALLPVLAAGASLELAAEEPYFGALRGTARPFAAVADLEPLLQAAGGRRLVLLGEASHGTHEYYHWRDQISRRLVAGEGFRFIAVEGDWTAILHLDRYVRHLPGAAASAREALRKIDRWPLWMWANEEMVELGEWLRHYNSGRSPEARAGIHGIDVYGMWQSLAAVQEFYDTHLPGQAEEVRGLYARLRTFEGDNAAYARHVYLLGPSAEKEVAAVAEKLRRRYNRADPGQRSALFKALQHAKVVKRGEMHLRETVRPGPHSWNARAAHFEETVQRLLEYYGPGSKGIVWAHNTHIGDARATSMRVQRQVNIGQLARERHGADQVFAVGFGTASGSVLAGREWDADGEVMRIPEPPPDSLEALMRRLGTEPSFWVFDADTPRVLRQSVPHRAIGVIYHPGRERAGNYIPTRLAERYDAFLFIPATRALQPLH